MITEPEVTFTDYGLAIECGLLAYLLYSRQDSNHSLRNWCVLFFTATGLAALTGGTVHGFFLNIATVGYRILWPITLVALGATALSAWAIGANILLSASVARWFFAAAALEFVAYTVAVLFITQDFMAVIINYLPAALFLLTAFLLLYRRTGASQPLSAIAGLGLTFVATWAQQRRIALHPVYFNHNALYHLIQAAALFLIFWAARWLLVMRIGTGR